MAPLSRPLQEMPDFVRDALMARGLMEAYEAVPTSQARPATSEEIT